MRGRLPEPPTADPTLGVEHDAASLVRFVIETGVTATLSREQLDRVSRFLPVFLTRANREDITTVRALVVVQNQVSMALEPFRELDMLKAIRAKLDMRAAESADIEGGSKVPRVAPIKPLSPATAGADLF